MRKVPGLPDAGTLEGTGDGVGKAGILLVSGSAGIGKSALVHALPQAVSARRGYFLSGTFEQLLREVPYAAIAQAAASVVEVPVAVKWARYATPNAPPER